MFWFSLFLFGTAIGIVSGLLGIGGGVLLVPGLIILFGFSQTEAQGTSLAVLIPPIGIFAALVYYQHGDVRLPVVGMIALGFMLGALAGAKIVVHINPAHLRIGFAALLLYLGFSFLLNPSGTKMNVALPAGLATMLAMVVGLFLRKKGMPSKQLPPPDEGHEYHI